MAVMKIINNPSAPWDGKGTALWWLGQAGFLIRRGGISLLIDPYLSDALAVKYKGKKYPHSRMMPPPVAPENLGKIDYYLSSHPHSDHLDPGLIPVVVKNSPECRFILPFGAITTAMDRGVPRERIIPLDSGETFFVNEDMKIHGIQSAHEELLKDDKGRAVYLGFILELGKLKIYHSGDCVPYPGLEEGLKAQRITLALLPVNGRRTDLTADGIAGNFTLDEALNLTESIKSDFMIPHHYGMFEFNTISPDAVAGEIEARELTEKTFPAEINTIYQLEE